MGCGGGAGGGGAPIGDGCGDIALTWGGGASGDIPPGGAVGGRPMSGGDIWFSGIVIGRTGPPSGAFALGPSPPPGGPPPMGPPSGGPAGGAPDGMRGFAICELSSLSSIGCCWNAFGPPGPITTFGGTCDTFCGCGRGIGAPGG